jgi:hypothetical protein
MSEAPIDYGNVPDVFATELVRIEPMGPVSRLVFAVLQDGGCGMQRVIINRVIVTNDVLARMGRQINDSRPAGEARVRLGHAIPPGIDTTAH